jgi:hypothetical protein
MRLKLLQQQQEQQQQCLTSQYHQYAHTELLCHVLTYLHACPLLSRTT